ncbi:hypothetical protein SpiGrapes_0575 [Sphaerochaeta pleomorpha str. Grapes]|uniref:Uncharacterized protein n=1 Tax=Sphaerochaeta pleomorpha (strain ATCC BAA-1885 / DSM 22778 / Grapes) TaxID=158190 RepID=G8QXC4_SPHPG|nr:hypothetical protein SpiGrapes_0575 [Sphaerochaeta pleomorpha str. Grapes]
MAGFAELEGCDAFGNNYDAPANGSSALIQLIVFPYLPNGYHSIIDPLFGKQQIFNFGGNECLIIKVSFLNRMCSICPAGKSLGK